MADQATKKQGKVKGRGQHPNSRKNLEKGAWTEGQSGNPNGVPPGTKQRGTILRKWADVGVEIVNPITKEKERATVEDEVVLSLIRESRKGNVQAIKEFLDTLYGKIPALQEITGKDGGAIQTEDVTRKIEITDD
jgi:hypothetical protein